MRVPLWGSRSPVKKFHYIIGAKNLRIDTLKRVRTASLYPAPKVVQFSVKKDFLGLWSLSWRKVKECDINEHWAPPASQVAYFFLAPPKIVRWSLWLRGWKRLGATRDWYSSSVVDPSNCMDSIRKPTHEPLGMPCLQTCQLEPRHTQHSISCALWLAPYMCSSEQWVCEPLQVASKNARKAGLTVWLGEGTYLNISGHHTKEKNGRLSVSGLAL